MCKNINHYADIKHIIKIIEYLLQLLKLIHQQHVIKHFIKIG